MILNFSLGEEPLTAKPNLKGGNWRARRRVQKLVHQNGIQFTPTTARNGPRENGLPEYGDSDMGVRPAKRLRVDDGFRPSLSKVSKSTDSTTSNRPHYTPKQFVSSLFTFNPASTTGGANITATQEDDEIKDEPSNAPLPEELLGLTSLGLSPSLATHLANKLNVAAPTSIQKEAIPTLLQNDTDAFIQAETGSGKTLAYLLPIVQRIMTLSSDLDSEGEPTGKESIGRTSGLFAIILAPTRELSKQISVVLENVLRCAHWIVPGIVIGGEKKQSEKARLRKGLNILVATPGRLADHLANTEVLDVSSVRWLVLDEGDRLMELGFEEDIKKIVQKLDSRKAASGIIGLPADRTNVLCSATMKMDVQRLGEISLKEAVHIRVESAATEQIEDDWKFAAPAQLKQTYITVPAKLRLVTLVAMLRRAFSRRGSVMKVIVFISCADSVDFHYEVLTRETAAEESGKGNPKDGNQNPKPNEKRLRHEKHPAASASVPAEPTTFGSSPVISNSTNKVNAYRLHGSLAQAVRTKTLQAFTKDTTPAFLICTDVASRGLDLPNVDLVIEYDPPFSKEEHLHRIGRTARAGRDGRASIFLMPGSEEGYVNILKEGRRDGVSGLTRHTAEEVLRKGFTAKIDGKEQIAGWDQRATDWELGIERWALGDPKVLEKARRAFQSHVRAYATHVSTEREMFNIKELHLGHLAKAFGLRDRPGSINVPGLRQNASQVREQARKGRQGGSRAQRKAEKPTLVQPTSVEKDLDLPSVDDAQEAVRRMRAKMRNLGGGADEFNLV